MFVVFVKIKITNMVRVRSFEVISEKFNVCAGGIST
jgi:hypothetical protein